MPLSVARALSCIAVLVVLLGGCRSGSPDSEPQSITVSDAWVRAVPDTLSTRTAAYARIEGTASGDDSLVSVESPIAGRVELHESTLEDDVMRMRQVESIAIGAGEAVELRPGGLHVMLLDLNSLPAAGDSVDLEFVFGSGERVSVRAPVREQ